MCRNEQGAVTAETAMALPVLVLVTLSMAWLVALGVTDVRALDAARETARAVARSDAEGSAVALGRRVAPAGSTVSVTRDHGLVEVTVSSPVSAPAGLFRHLSGFRVTAHAVAAQEQTS